MMNNMTIKFAASALAIGTTMVACTPAAQSFRPGVASGRAPKGEQQASTSYAKAQAAAQKGDLAGALSFAEQAVEASPRDTGYRMLLGDLYLKNGRFQSAETTFADVAALDPGNVRASLSGALAKIALGKTGAALAQLDSLSGTAPEADLGLAYALAGQPRRAIEMLEPSARAIGAGARVRQNLALAYALAGDWQKARTIAAQDVSPADLAARMEQWAAFAQPTTSSDQVASLLGVTPAMDPGQPVRLALAPRQTDDTAYAAAEPAPEPFAAEPAPQEPVQIAAAEAPVEPDSDWGRPNAASEPQAEPAEQSRPVYAEAVQSLVAPQPAVFRASASVTDGPIRAFEPKTGNVASARPHARAGAGRFAVQLGAFSSPSGVERAWAQAYRRYGFADHVPLSTTISLAGRGTFHRLSVAGFASHAEASRVCQSIKAKGGACFVRTVAGDAPVRWASRYTGGRRG
jgi:Flp pilus assembly protein TadD